MSTTRWSERRGSTAVGWAIVIVLAAVGASSCIPRPGTGSRAPTSAGADDASALTVTALPVYRLVTSPAALDSPSRLLVIQVRMATTTDAVLQFLPHDLSLQLPGGAQGHIFDRARAQELLRRTIVAEADLGYLQHPDAHPPGGINEYVRPQLADMVRAHLLEGGSFGPGDVLRGYVVVDTRVPLFTLDGAAMEVVVHRAADAAPLRSAYQFASVPAAEPQ
jgi:hypothetical protein